MWMVVLCEPALHDFFRFALWTERECSRTRGRERENERIVCPEKENFVASAFESDREWKIWVGVSYCFSNNIICVGFGFFVCYFNRFQNINHAEWTNDNSVSYCKHKNGRNFRFSLEFMMRFIYSSGWKTIDGVGIARCELLLRPFQKYGGLFYSSYTHFSIPP